MAMLSTGGPAISYIDEGEGDPILLIHGFASNKRVNWINPGWVETLTRAGYRVIALDNRGHGESEKPHDTALYGAQTMAGDAARLLAHLGIERAHVMGYSMGARITCFLALNHPDLVASAIFGGLGMAMVNGIGNEQQISDALLAPSLNDVKHRTGRAFRAFAEQTKSDRTALAACILSSRTRLSAEDVGRLSMPVLVAVGTRDDVAGSGAELAALIPNSEYLDITGRDHMVAVGDKVYKEGVLDFLDRHPL